VGYRIVLAVLVAAVCCTVVAAAVGAADPWFGLAVGSVAGLAAALLLGGAGAIAAAVGREMTLTRRHARRHGQ
jgi:hypothetical protein